MISDMITDISGHKVRAAVAALSTALGYVSHPSNRPNLAIKARLNKIRTNPEKPVLVNGGSA